MGYTTKQYMYCLLGEFGIAGLRAPPGSVGNPKKT
jgi:hypothetical protein